LFLNLYGISIFGLSQLLFVCFFKVIGVSFSKEAKELELPNSGTFGELKLHEMPLTLGMDSPMPHSPSSEVSPLHVIFYLNGVFVTTCFNRGEVEEVPSCTIIVRLGLKEFLERCIAQFHVYIWFPTQYHNIYNYLDQIWHETQIFITCSKVLDQEFYMQTSHFLPNKPNKPNFYKNLNILFSKYPYNHFGNMLFIDDTPCKIMFNGLYSAIFLEFFDDLHGHNHYLLGTIIYLESLHSSRFDVSNTIPLVGLDALIVMILENLKCYL